MSEEPRLSLADTDKAHAAAWRLFDILRTTLVAALPPAADIRHIGATAVPGCLTKGDLDIVVRVPACDFAAADAVLAARYARNAGSVRTDDFSAFEAPHEQPPLGIQLTAIGGLFDDFHRLVDALSASPDLLTAYNALKRAHDGGDMAAYREAKGAFVAQAVASAPQAG